MRIFKDIKERFDDWFYAVRKYDQLRELADELRTELDKRDARIEYLESRLNSPEYTSLEEAAVTLTRHLLNSIDLGDARSKLTMTPEERKEYVARISSNFDLLERLLKRLVIAQEEAMARGAMELKSVSDKPETQVVFGRGTINGIMLVWDELDGYFKEHMENLPRGKESFDKTKLFPQT